MAQPSVSRSAHVFVNRRPVELASHTLTVAELLAAAGFSGETWDVFRLKGETDPAGGDPLPSTAVLDVKDGERFRVVPGNRTFGSAVEAVGSPELRLHARDLEAATGYSVDVAEAGGQLFVSLKNVGLPEGAYGVASTDVLFITDPQYPLSALDMFWVDVGVVRANGSAPEGADQIESYLGRQWRRFSWHRNGTWNPASNGLLDHFEFMLARFEQDAPR